MCSPRVTKVVVDIKKFVLPSPSWGFETELVLGYRSERIRVERDPTLCELLNGYIGNLCGWLNFGNKSCVFVPTHFDLLIVLPQVCSCLEFGLTLSLIPIV
jgi:hypothetical protein